MSIEPGFLAGRRDEPTAVLLVRLERSAPLLAARAAAVLRHPDAAGDAGLVERRRALEDVLADLPENEPLSVDLRAGLARVLFRVGEPRLSIRECERTARLAARHGRPDAAAANLATQVMVETFHGRATAQETLARAAAPPADPADMPVWHSPRTSAARRKLWTGEVDEACDRLAALVVAARSAGDDESVALLYGPWTEALVRAGRLGEAAEVAAAAEAAARTVGRHRPEADRSWRAAWLTALVAVHRGDLPRARGLSALALAGARAGAGPVARIPVLATAGLAELLGGPEGAAAALPLLREARDLARATGLREPEFWLWHGDFVEAALAGGEVDEAAAVVATLRALVVELDRPSASALADRCEALVLAARGRVAEACSLLDQVVEQAAESRLERARSRLAAGIVAGRARRRGAAREHLARAAAEFAAMGAPGWRDRATAERGRVGATRAASGELTEGERRVAELVAEGRTNRQVAAVLFISVKTVEANLSRVYRKLHVTSRAQLARRLSAPPGTGV